MTRTAATLAALSLLLTASPALAGKRGDDKDRKSKNGHLEATIDGVGVALDYGRPKVRDRQVWGSLVPYGKVWRTGADEATTVTFEAPVTVAGKPLAAGTYSLFTVPGEEKWTVVFNSVADQWGAYDYDASKDVLRIEVAPQEGPMTEELTFAADDGAIVLRWEKLELPIPVAAQG